MSASGFICPKCGEDTEFENVSIDGWDDELFNDVVFVDMTCPKCKAEFTNVYSLTEQITHAE